MSELDNNSISFFSRPDPFVRLPELAERLGVKEGENLVGVTISLQDGRQYSLFDLIGALLDRLDRGCQSPS